MTIAIIAYLVYLAIFLLINLAIIYHVWKFSYPHDLSKIVFTLYFGVIISIVITTFIMIGVL